MSLSRVIHSWDAAKRRDEESGIRWDGSSTRN